MSSCKYCGNELILYQNHINEVTEAYHNNLGITIQPHPAYDVPYYICSDCGYRYSTNELEDNEIHAVQLNNGNWQIKPDTRLPPECMRYTNLYKRKAYYCLSPVKLIGCPEPQSLAVCQYAVYKSIFHRANHRGKLADEWIKSCRG